jgi:hypothetical protein
MCSLWRDRRLSKYRRLPSIRVRSSHRAVHDDVDDVGREELDIHKTSLTSSRVTILFILGSLRSSGAILSTLIFTALAFLCLGIQNLAHSDTARIAGGSFGILASACSWWGAMSGFWTKASPPLHGSA